MLRFYDRIDFISGYINIHALLSTYDSSYNLTSKGRTIWMREEKVWGSVCTQHIVS